MPRTSQITGWAWLNLQHSQLDRRQRPQPLIQPVPSKPRTCCQSRPARRVLANAQDLEHARSRFSNTSNQPWPPSLPLVFPQAQSKPAPVSQGQADASGIPCLTLIARAALRDKLPALATSPGACPSPGPEQASSMALEDNRTTPAPRAGPSQLSCPQK